MTPFRQLPSAGEPRRTRADDCNGTTCGSCVHHRMHAACLCVIHCKALQPADGNGFVVSAQHAGTLAQFLYRANACAGAAQQIRSENCVGRASQVTAGNLLDEKGDIDMSGTRVGTWRVIAVQTAVSLHGSRMWG